MSKIQPAEPVIVAALYRFFRFSGYQEFRAPLLNFCIEQNLKGTILLAPEGINGTLAGQRPAIANLKHFLHRHNILAGMEYKESNASEIPFHRMKVKLKREIVTMGVEGVDPVQKTGKHLDIDAWNQVICDPETLLIDARNQYEFEIGSFRHAISPATETFREFPAYVNNHLDPVKHKKIAMFCTGGIRCEKASAFLLQKGFEEVYQLKGGILSYLEEVNPDDNLWQGECFVFDGRVAVDEKLEQGSYEQCFACRRPVSVADTRSVKYVKGVSCPACHDELTKHKRDRFSERQRQVELAAARGEQHIGVPLKSD